MGYQSDYILRQIEMLGAALRRVLDRLAQGRAEEALRLSDEALSDDGSISPRVLERLTGEGLVSLMSAGGAVDPDKAQVFGELLYARADALEELGRAHDAANERDRAAALLRAARPEAEDPSRIDDLLRWIDEGRRAAETLDHP